MSVPGGAPPNNYGYIPRRQLSLDVIGEAWTLFTQNMGTWIIAQLIVAGISLGVGLVYGVLNVAILFSINHGNLGSSAEPPPISHVITGLSYLTGLLIGVFFHAGYFRMAIKQIRGQEISTGDLFSVGDVYLPCLLASFLVGLASSVAGLCLFLPAFIVLGVFMLTIPLIVDQGMSATEAMSKSWEILKSEWMMAALVFFVILIVSWLGVIGCGLGLLFTAPLMYLSVSCIYRDFIGGVQPTYPIQGEYTTPIQGGYNIPPSPPSGF